MENSGLLTIGEVVRRTGLTERTLRFYEQEGLVAPARSAGGQRLYGSADLDAVARIRLLKRAGFELAAIRDLLAGRAATADLVAARIDMLRAERRRIAKALAVVEPIQKRLAAGESMDAVTFCALIEAAECAADADAWRRVFDRYYSADEQAEWKALSARVYGEGVKQNAGWAALAADIKAAGAVDPASSAAQALLDAFNELLAPFARAASSEQMQAASAFWGRVGEWGEEVGSPWTQACSDFIRAAKAARAERHGDD